MAGGRPPRYKPEYAEQANKLCQLGATDADLASFFEVSTVTIWRWAGRYEEFCNALKTGKSVADERVERSLYHKAVGYTFDAVKIFMPSGAKAPVHASYREHVPPDTTACIFWLKNRRRQQWCDVHKHKHEHEHASQFDGMNEEQLRQWIITEATELGLGEVATVLGGGGRKTNGFGRG